MKQNNGTVGLSRICGLFGVTRQAYYEALEREQETFIEHTIILQLVKEIRVLLPLIGTRKLHFMLDQKFTEHGLRVGRDKLFDILSFYGLLIRRRKRIVRTTNSHHWLKKYPNLIKDLVITEPCQLWVGDITYISTSEGFSYLSLLTDAYSRKIVGYHLNQTLAAEGCLKALNMAISTRKTEGGFTLIHHSDRGIQYCCGEYVDILNQNDIAISMTQNSDPYENALAERVNGIIKSEFKQSRIYKSHEHASREIGETIRIYNEIRPHGSCENLTPNQAHKTKGPLKKTWKNYRKKISKV